MISLFFYSRALNWCSAPLNTFRETVDGLFVRHEHHECGCRSHVGGQKQGIYRLVTHTHTHTHFSHIMWMWNASVFSSSFIHSALSSSFSAAVFVSLWGHLSLKTGSKFCVFVHELVQCVTFIHLTDSWWRFFKKCSFQENTASQGWKRERISEVKYWPPLFTAARH